MRYDADDRAMRMLVERNGERCVVLTDDVMISKRRDTALTQGLPDQNSERRRANLFVLLNHGISCSKRMGVIKERSQLMRK